jgi:polyhydroxyalkanoate synthesis regulator phasin
MTPKSAKRFSDQVMRKIKRMTPKSAKRFSDQVMRKIKRMIAGQCSEKVAPQTREA